MAFANMDCGNQSISADDATEKGYTMDKIKQLCGEATEIKSWKEEFLTRLGNATPETFAKTTTHYTMWTYNRGSNTFIEYLLFKDGMLHDLKDGGYGTD